MSFRGVIEIIDRSGLLRSRVRVEHLPFRIGRALDNDLVLDDIYVCPHHAEVREEEALGLFDLNSVNGSFSGLRRAREARIALPSSIDFRLGHSLLRFRAANEVLETTAVDPLATSRLFAVDRFRWAIPALLACAGALLIERVLISPQMLQWGAVASAVVPALLVILLWALAWSMANRLVSHRFHYLGHLSIAALGVLVINIIDAFCGYLGFTLGADGFMSAVSRLLSGVLLATAIYGHLRLISRGSGRRLLVPAAAVAIAFVTLSLLPSASDGNFSSEPKLATSLKPPAAALRQGLDSDTFYTEIERAMDDADAEATEEE